MVLDSATVLVINHTNETLFFYRQFVECYKCPLLRTLQILPQSWANVTLSTIYTQKWAISPFNTPFLVEDDDYDGCLNLCSISNDCQSSVLDVTDQASYQLKIMDHYQCELDTLKSGRNNLYPFVITIILYSVFMYLLYRGVCHIRTRCKLFRAASNGIATNVASPRSSGVTGGTSTITTTDSVHHTTRHHPIASRDAEIVSGSPTQNSSSRIGSGRFCSIDAFRGLTILLMIFVNYGAGEYHLLQHAPWDGLHLADLVFPFFIFIMGASIAVSFRNLTLRSNIPPYNEMVCKIGLRSLKLFFLGLIVNSIGSTTFSTLRIPGVLQRFALCYLIVATIHLTSLYIPKRYRGVTGSVAATSLVQKAFRFWPLWPEYTLAAVMIFLYLYLTFWWEYDADCPIGYVGPGGLSDNMLHSKCVGGAAHRIDELIFTENHSYHNFFGAVLYDPERKMKLWHDPEGLLGTTTSVVLTLAGLQVGHILVYNHEPWARGRKWFAFSLAFFVLSQISMFAFHIPINKNLWSLSFILINGCIATILFAAFHFAIDISADSYGNHWWPFGGWPLAYAGQNSILLYLGHEVAHNMFPFTFTVEDKLLEYGGHTAFLVRNLLGTTVWALIAANLAKRKIFFTV